MNLRQRWKQTAVHNQALVLTSILVAFGTLFYSAAAVFQVWLMKQGSKHTDEQIGRIIGNANWLAREVDETAKETKRNNAQIALDAEASVKAIQDQMRLDQRAWVVMPGITGFPEVGKVWKISVHFTNVGRTPALHVLFRCASEWKPRESSLRIYRSPYTSPSMLIPNEDEMCEMSTGVNNPVITQANIDQFHENTKTIFVYGSAIYADTFNQSHWVTFCAYLDTQTLARWGPCKEHQNDTGDGDKPPIPFGGPVNAQFGVIPSE